MQGVEAISAQFLGEALGHGGGRMPETTISIKEDEWEPVWAGCGWPGGDAGGGDRGRKRW